MKRIIFLALVIGFLLTSAMGCRFKYPLPTLTWAENFFPESMSPENRAKFYEEAEMFGFYVEMHETDGAIAGVMQKKLNNGKSAEAPIIHSYEEVRKQCTFKQECTLDMKTFDHTFTFCVSPESKIRILVDEKSPILTEGGIRGLGEKSWSPGRTLMLNLEPPLATYHVDE